MSFIFTEFKHTVPLEDLDDVFDSTGFCCAVLVDKGLVIDEDVFKDFDT
jgi:hypothetical protein